MIFLIHGPPGSGKSTLARQLSQDLCLPHISSDRLAEWLTEIAQNSKDDLKGFIGGAGYELMFRIAGELSRGRGSFIIEGCINPEFGGKRLLKTVESQNHDIFEIFVTACERTLLERYRQRAGTSSRHAAHGDEYSRSEELKIHLETTNYRPSKIGKYLIEIDNGENPQDTFQLVMNQLNELIPGFVSASRKEAGMTKATAK